MPPEAAPRAPLLLAAALLALLALPGCLSSTAGTWEFAPAQVDAGVSVRDLREEDVARLPAAVVAALDAAARGERRLVDLTDKEAAALRKVVPENPAVVRHRGALVGLAQVSIHD